MDKPITINIEGEVGSGKSFVAGHLAKLLKSFGAEVSVHDEYVENHPEAVEKKEAHIRLQKDYDFDQPISYYGKEIKIVIKESRE